MTITVSACAPQPGAGPAGTSAPLQDSGARASLIVVWPCMDSFIAGKKTGAYNWSIVVNNQAMGKIAYCSHNTVSIPAGKIAIRVADPNFDLAGAFGNQGEVFTVQPNGRLYVLVIINVNAATRLIQIDQERANAEIKTIDANNKSG